MKVTKTMNGTTLTAALEGRLDTTTSPELEREMKDELDKAEALIMDLSGLEYISSAGLRLMLSFHKAMAGKGGMKVVHANEMVMEVFDITGFSDILDIE